MKSRMFTFFAAAVCSISGLAHVSAEITIEPDMEIQGGIRDVVSAVTLTVGPAEKEALERGLEQLLGAAKDDRKFLMLQVIYWAAHTQEPGIRDYVMPFSAYVFEQLHLSDEEILEMALPYLTDKTPYKVRYFTRGILGHIYTVYKDDGPTTFDFSFFANRIANQSEQNPEELYGLIDTIYEEDPGEVVLALMRAHGASSGEIAAMEEAERWLGPMYRRGFRRESDPDWDLDRILGYLDYYSQSGRWWERLYAATILGEVRQLRTDPVVRRLRSDTHPVIRGKLEGVHPKDER